MATLPNGIFGPFVGRAGNITGYIKNGKNFIRIRHRNGKVTPTVARLAQREKIKVCGEFTKAFARTGFFSKTFPAYGNKGTGYNRATSALMNLSITGTYPGISLTYPLVLVSKGPLPAAENASAEINPDGNLLFKWANNSGTGTAKANDVTILVAYFAALNQSIFTISAGVRADGEAILPIRNMHGYAAETWIGFLNNSEHDAANSVYTGRIEV